jgi:uncharacterized sulfatase
MKQTVPMAVLVLAIAGITSGAGAAEPSRPNILWITSEDNGPQLGAYGDLYATTPNLDRLASQGILYLNAWSNAPVCAPARTTIISGLYPPSTGAEHMRSMVPMPAGMKMYPQLLREAGYYCTNNSKEDYNLRKSDQVWDESSPKAHWKNRRPGQPFFAVFNILCTHESQIRKRPHTLVHDPAKARVPAYHPDTPEVRHDWAQYYDNLTQMDRLAGERLRELQEAGLADDTIVFYYGDHGPGMPRCKRWPYNSGLRVPLIVVIPAKYKHLAPPDYAPGAKSERLVSFVDLAPTLMSLVGVRPPDYLQGHAFLGPHAAAPQPYVYGFRGRMDERYDLVRSVRDQRYVYIRNYMPHKIYGQYINYLFQMPTVQVWKQLYDEDKLSTVQQNFWKTKPAEELYDLTKDPDEVQNLADSPAHQAILQRLREAQRQWVLTIRDVGFLPEAEIHSRSAGSTPYDLGHAPGRYPLERILSIADQASSLKPEALPALKKAFQDADSAVRYWAALGILMRGPGGVAAARDQLRQALRDPAPSVRIAAAEALGRYGCDADTRESLAVLLELAPQATNGPYVSLQALNAIDELDQKAASGLSILGDATKTDWSIEPRMRSYAPRLLEKLLGDLKQ